MLGKDIYHATDNDSTNALVEMLHSSTPPGNKKSSLFPVSDRNYLIVDCNNRPFAGSGHMVRNKLRWDANDAVGLPNQRKVGLDWYEFLCFGSPTASFASQRNLQVEGT